MLVSLTRVQSFGIKQYRMHVVIDADGSPPHPEALGAALHCGAYLETIAIRAALP